MAKVSRLHGSVILILLALSRLPSLGQEPGSPEKETQALLKGLLAEGEETRKKSLRRVWKIGPDLPGVLDALKEGRKKVGPEEGVLYLAALAHLDMEDSKSALELGHLLRQVPSWIPALRGKGLLPMGPHTRGFFSMLRPLMEDDDPRIRANLCSMAGVSRSRTGKAREILFLGLGDLSAWVRRVASGTLGGSVERGFRVETVEELESVVFALRWGHRDFGDEEVDPRKKGWALGPALFVGVSRREDLLLSLGSLLEDPCPRVRAWAIRCLGRNGSVSKEVEKTVRKNLNHSDQEVRLWAHYALATVSEYVRLHLRGIESFLLNPVHPRLRVEACDALSWLGEIARPSAGALLKCILKSDGSPLLSPVSALVAVGGLRRKDEGWLLSGLLERNLVFFQVECGTALLALGPSRHAIGKFLKGRERDFDPVSRMIWGPVLLSKATGGPLRTVPNIAKLLFSWSTHEYRHAWKALHALGPDAAPALPVLDTLLALKDWRRVDGLMDILQSIGKDAVPLLIKSARSTRWWIRAAAVRTLRGIDVRSPEIDSVLSEAMKDSDPDVRRAARAER